jgi:putative peptide zinc metalloprotease protein
MSAVSESLVASSERKVALRMRRDLVACRHVYQGQPWWVVKDPLALAYYRFPEEDFAILEMLDGRSSLTELREKFARRFAPRTVTAGELEQLIGSLHRSRLVVSDAAGQGHELKKRRDERKWKERISEFTNVLSLRFRGIDPDRLLTAMYPWVKWMFSPAAFICSLLLGLAALLWITVQWDDFHARLPGFQQFFTRKNGYLLAVVLCVTKVMHEFGHGLACKHFGRKNNGTGECHEMGVMLLVLTPCLYCNVSDSTMLPSKWQRAAIGAAGMYVELVLASIATFLWWFSQPGLFHNLCLSTMFVSSVSTVMFNANPLMRYDGYYILSDLLEIPNLRQRANEVVQRFLQEWCLGLELPPAPFMPRRKKWLFALFTVSAGIYRWVITFSILWFLHKFFERDRLEVIGQALGVMSIYGLVVLPLWRVGKFFRTPGRTDKVKRKNVVVSLGIVAALLAFVLLVPLPHHVLCSLEVQPRDAAIVYVDMPGTLEEVLVRPGDEVRKGQELARLGDDDLAYSIAQLTGEHDRYLAQLTSLQRQKFVDPAAGAQIPQVAETVAALDEQLTEKLTDQQRLVLKAPVAGTVMPPVEVPKQENEDGRLSAWWGTPFDARNLGCLLMESTPFCQIGDPAHWQANLVIDQADVEFVRPGQTVKIKLDELPHDTLRGEIEEVARHDLKISPRQLSNKSGGELATRTDAAGIERPLNVSYEARVPLDDPEGLFRLGLRGRAKIHTAPQTLGQRLWRYLTQTFHFKL